MQAIAAGSGEQSQSRHRRAWNPPWRMQVSRINATASRKEPRMDDHEVLVRDRAAGRSDDRTDAAQWPPGGPADRGRDAVPEDGRGRSADAPHEIPAVGWKDILLRVYRGVYDDRVLANAAAVA